LTRNLAITDYYEPGSVVKVLTTAAAIDLKLVNPNTSYVDTGTVKVYDATIQNWDFSVNGPTTVTEYLQRSLNTGSVWLSKLVGPDRFYDYMARFGFGEETGMGFSAETPGLVRTPDDPKWSPVDLATNSYGQGIGASPVQVLTALNTVANGGMLMRPYIVKEISGPGKHYVAQPEPIRRVISEETSLIMRELMNEVVDGMPSHLAKTPGYRVGGKTGTTLVSIPGGYDLNSTLASFVGYVPAQDPVLGVLIKIDQPKDDPLGGKVAAPVFPKLATPILNYMDVRPSAPARVQR
jgi:cell division protein FtsI/penicillin-binding protein 2